jgi:hypothetical protein
MGRGEHPMNSEFNVNKWFHSLPEERRKVLRENKWILAGAVSEAAKAFMQKEIDQLNTEIEELMQPKLKELHYDSSGLNAQFEGGAVHLFAAAFIEQFKESGATNYLTMSFTHPDGEFEVTLQRAGGLSPSEKAAELQEEVEALKEQRLALVEILEKALGKLAGIEQPKE